MGAERRTEPLYEDSRVAPDGDPARALAESETRRELGRCLAELPAAQARVVVLQDAFDVPFEEISAATGLPVGTAKCYAHRGRNGLRERLVTALTRRCVLDKAAIEAVLPHRDPMLLIDEVIELVPGERVVARKTVTDEDCAGHFPGQPDHARREDGRGARPVRRRRRALAGGEPRQARALRRHRRRALQARRAARATC